MVTRPQHAPSRLTPALAREDIPLVLKTSEKAAWDAHKSLYKQILVQMWELWPNPRRDLGGWVVSNAAASADTRPGRGVHLMVGERGGVGVAVDVGFEALPEQTPVPQGCQAVGGAAIESTVLEVLTLTRLIHRHLGIPGPVLVRAQLADPTDGQRLICSSDQVGKAGIAATSRSRSRVRPVEADVTDGLLHPFGVQRFWA